MGHDATYHPRDGGAWLKENGLREEKCGSIEIYNAADYLRSNNNWGVGGGLLHELAHAYHDQHCPGGFESEKIRDAYMNAMDCKLYDAVPVHGVQGKDGPVKAYACTNVMEFFAELSVAFLWREDETTEYNKWFPHNYAQLLRHDPASCELLSEAWGCS